MWPLSRHPDLLPRGHAFFERYGAWAIVLGRFSGPFRASVPIVAGAAQMDRFKFQVANWSSALLWAFVLLALVFGLGCAAAAPEQLGTLRVITDPPLLSQISLNGEIRESLASLAQATGGQGYADRIQQRFLRCLDHS